MKGYSEGVGQFQPWVEPGYRRELIEGVEILMGLRSNLRLPQGNNPFRVTNFTQTHS
ncbi:MAG TPA: hypothetical protein VIR01_09410 [Pyrinomonadaceae bacterium]